MDKKSWSDKFSEKTKWIITAVLAFLLFVSIASSVLDDAKKKRELAAQQAQIQKARVNYCNNNRTQILDKIKKNLESEKYYDALVWSEDHIDCGWEEVIKYNQEAQNAISQIKNEIEQLVGKKVPYEKWKKWGVPETLEGTNNTYWLAYLPKVNISFISLKKNDTLIFYGLSKNSAQNFFKEKNKKRQERLESQFNAWNGSHYNLTQFIKNAMNDPKSYEHVETVYWDKGDYLVVTTRYRGNNLFGGKVLGMVRAKVSLDGSVLQIIEQQ